MLGMLSEFTLAHILQLFAVSEKSGTISIHSRNIHARLLIESDKVIGLGADDFDVYADLLRIEQLSARQRAALLELEPRQNAPGLSFIVGNHIDPHRWQLYVARHFEQDVYPLLHEDDGAIEVIVERCPSAPLKVFATVQQIILDCSRWEAEFDALRAEGYHLDAVWQRCNDRPTHSTIGLEHSGWLVWAALASRSSVADLASRLGVPDLVAAATTKQLHALELIERTA